MKHKYTVSRIVSYTETIDVIADSNVSACVEAQKIFDEDSESDEIYRYDYNCTHCRAELDEEQLVEDLLNVKKVDKYFIRKLFEN